MRPHRRSLFAACLMFLSLPLGLGICADTAAASSAVESPAAKSTADKSAAEKGTESPIQAFVKRRHLTVVKRFPTAAASMTGYVLQNVNGDYGIVYTVDDLLVSTQVIYKDGKNLAAQYADAYIPKPDYAAAVKKIDADKHIVVEGRKGAPSIYVIADPNCIFCHKFYAATRGWVKHGKVRLHWVMVGFLKPSSAGRAAAIMAAKNRLKAFHENYSTFDAQHEEGALPPLKPVPAALEKVIKAHEKLMTDVRFQGTPGLIYKNKEGKWEGIAGMPSLAGLAKQMGIKAD